MIYAYFAVLSYVFIFSQMILYHDANDVSTTLTLCFLFDLFNS
jgi:hypothetical protein